MPETELDVALVDIVNSAERLLRRRLGGKRGLNLRGVDIVNSAERLLRQC